MTLCCPVKILYLTLLVFDCRILGTMPEALYGVCESLWKPNMEPDELFEVTAQCLLAGLNRDALSGWGSVVYVITKDKTYAKSLKGRMD